MKYLLIITLLAVVTVGCDNQVSDVEPLTKDLAVDSIALIDNHIDADVLCSNLDSIWEAVKEAKPCGPLKFAKTHKMVVRYETGAVDTIHTNGKNFWNGNYYSTETNVLSACKETEADVAPLELLPDGEYKFDIAFAEWQGKSMGEAVTVVIKGDHIKIIYQGTGNLSNTKIGDVLDEGTILKHKSGVWIISSDPSDADLDEVGGCTGGPSVIDFVKAQYWMC